MPESGSAEHVWWTTTCYLHRGATALSSNQVGDQKAPLRFARALDTAGGRLVTVVASQPILHIRAGVPDAKPKAGYDLAFATFEVDSSGKGNAGDLATAATLKVGANDAIVVDDGTEAVRLSGIAKK